MLFLIEKCKLLVESPFFALTSPLGRVVRVARPEAASSPTNKFWAEFSGAYKWEDTALRFPPARLLESRKILQKLRYLQLHCFPFLNIFVLPPNPPPCALKREKLNLP